MHSIKHVLEVIEMRDLSDQQEQDRLNRKIPRGLIFRPARTVQKEIIEPVYEIQIGTLSMNFNEAT